MTSLVIIDGIEYVPRSETSEFDTDHRADLINYIKDNVEGFTDEHIDALKHIVVLINQSENSEKEILEFARHLFRQYYCRGQKQ